MEPRHGLQAGKSGHPRSQNTDNSNMKKKINKEEDHKLWGISSSPEVLIKYVAIDAYATYESWKKIDNIKQGLDRAKEEEENPYYHYDF